MSKDSNSFFDTGRSPMDSEAGAIRQHVYRIMSDPTNSPTEKQQELLDLGREHLGVENGHIVKIDSDTGRHEIVAATGSDLVTADSVTTLAETYCRETITSEAILTIHDTHQEEWQDDPATERWNIDCYIGTKLLVEHDLYGTVCFVDSDPRDNQFTAEERSSVDLLSASISRLLERDRFEEKLEQSEELFQLFIEEVTDYAIFMLDPAGHVITWNKGMEEIKGYTEDEIIGEHFGRFYPEAECERGKPEQLLDTAWRDGRVEDEGWRVRKDGSTFWALVTITALYDDDGALRGFGKVTRDLTERRSARHKLESEQAFIEQALDTLDDVFFVVNPEGEIERVNQQFLDVTGYSENQALSMDPAECFAPTDRDRIHEAITDVLNTGETTLEATLLAKHNERRRYEFRGRRLTDEDGTVLGAVGIGRDITEQTLYEERLEVAQRMLRHNLRNELNVIGGWVETLADRNADDSSEALDRVLTAIDRLIDLSEKTHQMTQLDPFTGEAGTGTDVTRRVPEIVGEVQSQYPDAKFDLNLPAVDSLPLATDERCEIAIRNAIQNALEHNPRDTPWVGIDVESREGQVWIHVHDDGPGILEMERQTLENAQETSLEHGSGLGLWLIHWCVTTAGGEMTFDEREPQGSTVSMSLPLSRNA